ncbi:VWA domain-containing protein [Massilia sp. DWR3-1-1]|uniref:VWA domain-containing protein n=1 Tax=Massilia sp. DWR3-1-1 TaxID=2804559 RepID=UPI003CF086D4
METLSKGQRLLLDKQASTATLRAEAGADGIALDYACFGLDANGKLVSEAYMTFFNQPRSPCGGVTATTPHTFSFALARLPAQVDRLVITASIDGAGTLRQLRGGHLDLFDASGQLARFAFTGTDFADEKALMLGELYRKDGDWRFKAVGQGFNGGLDALVRHFGGEVAAPSSAPPPPSTINFEKRVAQQAPQLVSLVKSAGVSLAKVGLDRHRAKVCLVLDISGSMGSLYKSGQVQRFAERVLALGGTFDDDGEIDVFLFGRHVHQGEPMGLSNWSSYIKRIIERHPLEGDTRYGAAIEAVRRHYFPDAGGGARSAPHHADVPVYVMFVTDGTTSDQAMTERQLRWASHEPIFWQFMGIGKGKKSKNKKLAQFADSDFPFLEKLDDLDGRLIDNANYFSVASPDEHGDADLYDLLMGEYPAWLKLARGQGMLG